MAKGDSSNPLARIKQPMSPTNQYGEQKPLGWEGLVQPTMGGRGGQNPSGGSAPRQSMFQNMGQMGGMVDKGLDQSSRFSNFMQQFKKNQPPPFQANYGQGGFNVGPNQGFNPFSRGMGNFSGKPFRMFGF